MPTEVGEINWIDNLGMMLVTFLTETVPQFYIQHICLNRDTVLAFSHGLLKFQIQKSNHKSKVYL